MDAAEALYGARSIDSVSLREITARARQKNPSALQYHFKDRKGLLQAIVDRHSARIGTIRARYIQRALDCEWPATEAAARCLAMPIVDYIEANPQGLNFVKIVSQLTALNQGGTQHTHTQDIRFPQNPALGHILEEALTALPPREAQRRIYLAVNITFHSIADIYRASQSEATASPFAKSGPMVEQLICAIEAFFTAATTSP